MKKNTGKLPGNFTRILSFIPALNCFALIYIGAANSSTINTFCGVAYFILSVVIPDISPLIWLICLIHYSVAYSGIRKRMNDSTKHYPTSSDSPIKKNPAPQMQRQFSDVTLSGTAERRQAIPARTASSAEQVRVSFSAETSHGKFFREMQIYADKVGTQASFQPFMTYWPTYDSMSRSQQAWYFYWRSQVRSGKYSDTDLSYIFVHIYELLSGFGWKTPEDGYDQLLKLWDAYQERFPKLDHYLYEWTFDFAQLHGLVHRASLANSDSHYGPSCMTDILVDLHAKEVPLKLPFTLIDALCDYSLVGSKFYQDGNQKLLQEAIPRVVALADAALRKKTQKGILSTYGPNRPKKQEYCAFRSAVCPEANKKISVSIKAYSSNERLRGYINELVRFGENTLRALYGYRGRLRGVTIDDETAKLIEGFLKKEYGKPTVAIHEPGKKMEIALDFQSIHALREQSDAVRAALQVEVPEQPVKKELLTDIAEVSAIYMALSPIARQLLHRLQASSWEFLQEAADEPQITEINRLAEHYLGCALLVRENNTIIAEDDYQDELAYICENTPEIPTSLDSGSKFDPSILSPELQGFVQALVPEQRKVLYVLLTQENPQGELERIAEETMTMPQMLLDDINEAAMRTLGDIVVDAMDKQPYILDEYVSTLKKSIA